MRRGEQSKGGYGRVDVQGRSDASRNYNLERFQCTRASDMGSISHRPLHNSTMILFVLTPLDPTEYGHKIGVFGPMMAPTE